MSKKSDQITAVGYRDPRTNESLAVKSHDEGGVIITGKSSGNDNIVSIALSKEAAISVANAIHVLIK